MSAHDAANGAASKLGFIWKIAKFFIVIWLLVLFGKFTIWCTNTVGWTNIRSTPNYKAELDKQLMDTIGKDAVGSFDRRVTDAERAGKKGKDFDNAVLGGYDNQRDRIYTAYNKTHNINAAPSGPPLPGCAQSLPIQAFTVYTLSDKEYEIQLDARESWRTGLKITGPAHVEATADINSQISSPPECPVGPKGAPGLARTAHVSPQQFPVGDANFLSLLGRIDDQEGFEIGEFKEFDVDAGTHELKFMSNIRRPYLHEASGGHKLRLKVTLK